jgi:CheY-like chemotaxis protein
VVEVAFEEDAPTVPEQDRAHLFDRLPPPGTGARAGLDLAVARHLLELDGGTLRHEPRGEGGNRLVLALPIDASLAREPVVEPQPDPLPRPLTVLVCDDEESIRVLIGRILDRGRHVTLKAASGPEALEILDREPVDIVMSDHRMADMSGVELYRAACDRYPHLRRRFVFMSGDPGDQELRDFASGVGLPVLGKPFSFTKLEMTIRELADS